jgi:hypothetical protein
MLRAGESLIPSRPLSASPVPSTYAVHVNGWMPVIHHPERARFLRYERFPRKIKATHTDAIEYARRTIFYRTKRAAEKRRHLEAIEHPRFGGAA